MTKAAICSSLRQCSVSRAHVQCMSVSTLDSRLSLSLTFLTFSVALFLSCCCLHLHAALPSPRHHAISLRARPHLRHTLPPSPQPFRASGRHQSQAAPTAPSHPPAPSPQHDDDSTSAAALLTRLPRPSQSTGGCPRYTACLLPAHRVAHHAPATCPARGCAAHDAAALAPRRCLCPVYPVYPVGHPPSAPHTTRPRLPYSNGPWRPKFDRQGHHDRHLLRPRRRWHLPHRRRHRLLPALYRSRPHLP